LAQYFGTERHNWWTRQTNGQTETQTDDIIMTITIRSTIG